MPNPKMVKQNGSLGERLFEALTQQEITLLLDALFAVLLSDRQDAALDQLPPDTKQTVQQILSVPKPSGDIETTSVQSISLAKLEQTWSNLWNEWGEIVAEAAQEDGDYMTQDEHWEPPYFDQTAFIEDLEQVAKKMRPLIQSAVQHNFLPNMGFAEALSAAEDEVSAAMPDWIEIDGGFYLEENLTFCLLEWEWLKFKEEEEEGAFDFVQHILDWEDAFTHVTLGGNAFVDFFTQLPEPDQKVVFQGLTGHKDTPPWKNRLENTYSYWHILYMYWVEQYTPERYLDNLRLTISQKWQNGLPVIEDLLTKRDYQESLKVTQETLTALLKSERGNESWTPETSLLFTLVNGYGNDDELKNHKTLLDYYQQTAKGLEQTQLSNTLALQLIAFNHCFVWKTMFNAFKEAVLPQPTRQTLFESWRDYIVKRARPYTWEDFGWTKTHSKTWWLLWLIDSIVDEQKGTAWFQREMAQWLTHLPGDRASSGENFNFLRLLTKDLTEMDGGSENQYPKFYQVVVRPVELSSPDQSSRQAYLKQYASHDLLDQVMAYWKTHLQNFVPRPEAAQKSDYTQHAHWMTALRELAPQSYEVLLNEWRVEHQRRRNLWQAMARMELN